MKAIYHSLLYLALALAVSVPIAPFSVQGETVRPSVWDGRFYESDPLALGQHIDGLTHKAQKTRLQMPRHKHLKAIIMPHAGYIYSGWTAAHAGQVLSPDQFSKVILLGPDHRVGFKSAAICNAKAYETPLGKINLHKDSVTLRLQPDLFQTLMVTQDHEHSLEVILPFLQRYLHDFQLVPVIVGYGDVGALSNALDSTIDSRTLLVVSSDLSHYLPYAEAVARDRETIDCIVNLKPEILANTDNRACGKTPLLILMEIARRHRWQPVFLHYSNSGDTAGDASRVVGYTAIAFFEDQKKDNSEKTGRPYSDEQGQVLVKLARQTIMEKLGMDVPGSVSQDLVSALGDDCFDLHYGTFVTLKIKGQLRGCIGSLTSTETVAEGVRRNALNAAFHDPRFSPLTLDELDRITVEVSILTEPQPLSFRGGQDLINKLRPHVDGVIVRKGYARATFLPQVWDQLPLPEDFLSHLCMKAGLSSHAWKDSDLEVLTYQVQYFE
jgi:MEMO1 family protein